MRFRTDDPAWDAECFENWKESLNTHWCDCCGDPIQEDYAYSIQDKLYCPACIEGMKVNLC